MSKKITFFISIIGLGVVVSLTVFFISQQVFGAISVQNEINMNNRRIIGLPVPTTTNEVARKAYVDSLGGVSGNFSVGGNLAVGGTATVGKLVIPPGDKKFEISGAGSIFMYGNELNTKAGPLHLQHTGGGAGDAGTSVDVGHDLNVAGILRAYNKIVFYNVRTGYWGDVCWYAGNQVAYCSSSAKHKLNIKDLGIGLDTVMQLTPREFDWTEEMSGRHDLGLVAEEVELVNPLLATYYDNGELIGVKYSRMVALLIKAIQEQQGEIEKLRQEIELLKAILNK